MSTNPAIREELLAHLGVTKQRLSQLAKKRKGELPMSTTQAVYSLAHENGVDLSKHLSKDEVSEVRILVSQLRGGGSSDAVRGDSARRSVARRYRPVEVAIAGIDVGAIPGLKASHAREAQAMAQRVYPTLYLFENSVRDVIEAVLKEKHGNAWWAATVPAKVRESADKFKKDELKETWHGKRGRRDIDYLTLAQLWAIIHHNWKDFAPLFPQGPSWVQSLIEHDMNVSRRVVAHMNPLAEDDIKGLEATFRKWVKHLKAVEAQLP